MKQVYLRLNIPLSRFRRASETLLKLYAWRIGNYVIAANFTTKLNSPAVRVAQSNFN